MGKSKFHRITFRINEEQFQVIQEKCLLAESNSISEYIRSAALRCNIYVAPQEEWEKIWKAASKTTINLEQICLRYQVIEKKQSKDISEIKDFSSRISRLCVDIIILLAVRK